MVAGSEWFYPEGPAPPFSAGTGAAPCSSSPAMAFTFAAFCYMLALLLTAALIFFAIWHVSSRGRGKKGEVAAQPFFAPGPWSGRPRPSEVRTPGNGARPGRCRPRGQGPARPRSANRGLQVPEEPRRPAAGWLRPLCPGAGRARRYSSLAGWGGRGPSGPCGTALRWPAPHPRVPASLGRCRGRRGACYVLSRNEVCRNIII